MTLTEFLSARIAEDEAVATDADYKPGRRWRHDTSQNTVWDGTGTAAAPHVRPAGNSTTGAHIARWDPARVLAECEAKRHIINLHAEAVAESMRSGSTWAYGEVLRRLALPYADHPYYQQEWRP